MKTTNLLCAMILFSLSAHTYASPIAAIARGVEKGVDDLAREEAPAVIKAGAHALGSTKLEVKAASKASNRTLTHDEVQLVVEVAEGRSKAFKTISKSFDVIDKEDGRGVYKFSSVGYESPTILRTRWKSFAYLGRNSDGALIFVKPVFGGDKVIVRFARELTLEELKKNPLKVESEFSAVRNAIMTQFGGRLKQAYYSQMKVVPAHLVVKEQTQFSMLGYNVNPAYVETIGRKHNVYTRLLGTLDIELDSREVDAQGLTSILNAMLK